MNLCFHLMLWAFLSGLLPLRADRVTARVIAFGEVVATAASLEVRDDQVFLSLEDACRWLHLKKADSSGERITLQGLGGECQPVVLHVEGKHYVSVVILAEVARAEIAWMPAENTLYICGRLEEVCLKDSTLRISLFSPHGQSRWRQGLLRKPDRIFIDMPGFRCPRSWSQELADGPVARIRSGQFQPDTARVVLELREDIRMRRVAADGPNLLRFQLESLSGVKADKNTPGDSTGKPGALSNKRRPSRTGSAGADRKPAVLPAQVTAIRLERIDEGCACIRVEASQPLKGKMFFLRNPVRLAIDIPNATLSLLESIAVPENPFLKGIRAAQLKVDVTRIVMDLSRMVTFSMVSSANPSGFLMELSLPRGGEGSLSGKTVVVDPGHGGKDTGTRGRRLKLLEKDINLDIALRLEMLLKEGGVNVLLTRRDDTFIPLPDRVAFARDNAADFFISIHCDNSGGSAAVSGTKTYYHGSHSENIPLAEAIQSALVSSTGLTDLGTRADTTVYNSGFHVIRNTTMPGVLIETAYLSNPDDEAKLNDPEFRQKMAQGIYNGLKSYVEGLMGSPPAPALEEAPR